MVVRIVKLSRDAAKRRSRYWSDLATLKELKRKRIAERKNCAKLGKRPVYAGRECSESRLKESILLWSQQQVCCNV